MSDINEKILEAIGQSLPAATAGELKKYIEQAESDKKQLVAKNDEIIRLKALSDDQQKRIKEFEAMFLHASVNKSETERLAAQRIDLDHRQSLQDITSKCESDKTNFALECLKTVFKSQPIGYAFDRSVTKTEAVPVQGYNNGPGHVQRENVNETERVTKKDISE